MCPVRIDPGAVPPSAQRRLALGAVPPERHFTFSLRYWMQVESFGLGDVDSGWFISFLDRLHDLCKEKVGRFLDDRDFQDAIRYHVVDWDARSIPISRQNLSWLPVDIRDNEVEFPIVQFHVSRAMGRVHGFWDRDGCFQIVLIDPMHNLQPSADTGYRVRRTSIAECKYSAFRIAIDRACARPCSDTSCELSRSIADVLAEPVAGDYVILAGITADVASRLEELRRGRVISMSEIIEHGITFWGE